MDTRRYDLDWVRVIAFGLLIFYHIGMYYVTWGWHVKSPYAGEFSEPAMRLLNPWRLSLLFFISGIAIRYYYDKQTVLWKAGLTRFGKLFIPLFFGMHVVVAPQSYYELLASGEIQPGFWDFYITYLIGSDDFSVHIPTWNHLWYVAYLLIYCALAGMLFRPIIWLSKLLEKPWFTRWFGGGRIFVLPALVFVFYRFTVDMHYPEKHNLFGDWGAHARYGTYFLIGMLLAKNEQFWMFLKTGWKKAAIAVVVLGAVLTLTWNNWSFIETQEVPLQIARIGRVVYAWAVIMVIFGAAQDYLNKPSSALSYFTKAVFPYYILHQTIIVVAGVWLSGFALGATMEFLSLLMITSAGCVLLYEFIIRPLGWLHPFFGVFGKAPSFKGKKAK